jgi:hypothetical protein
MQAWQFHLSSFYRCCGVGATVTSDSMWIPAKKAERMWRMCWRNWYGPKSPVKIKNSYDMKGQDRKGLTLSSMQHEVVVFAILPAQSNINASSAVWMMLQCFPAHITSKFKRITVLKHRCNPIIVSCMTRILFFKNGHIKL